MSVELLSRRHRPRGEENCDCCCNYSRNTAKFRYFHGDGKTSEVDICAACLREGVKVATEGRKVDR